MELSLIAGSIEKGWLSVKEKTVSGPNQVQGSKPWTFLSLSRLRY